MRKHGPVIVWGVCAGGRGERFDRVARPALERAAAGADRIEVRYGDRGICAAYNELIDLARSCQDLEALVLVHDDVEIVDPGARSKILAEAARPGTGVLGVVGGRRAVDACWWACREQYGYVVDSGGVLDLHRREGVVDMLDGLCLVLAPAAVASLRFDAALLPGFHGYDVDICLAARDLGLENRVIPLDLVHRDKASIGDAAAFEAAKAALREKWRPWIRPVTLRERAAARARGEMSSLRDMLRRGGRPVSG